MKRLLHTCRTSALSASILFLMLWTAAHGAKGSAAESRAHVRLVRLLEEVPDSERAALGGVHDLRLRLEPGNVLLLRRGGEFAAVMPIEVSVDDRDSLRYFYYLEHSPFLWVFPGQKDKGIGTAGNGGVIHINTFDLVWRAGPGQLGWIYFPDNPTNQNVRFSVVSGRTVDEADPMDTKYWVELGPAESSGF
jgi:hypothetical protein